ncbi:MAG: hypothetical protein AAFU85_06420 [Planctomycetota bacterium]
MRNFFISLFSLSLLFAAGCGTSDEGTAVATTEDEFAQYDAIMNEMESQTAEDEASEE